MTTNFHAQWIVGFVDASSREGCFHLDVHRKKDMKWGLQMQPEFTVVQNEVDIQILHALKDFFQCGSVGINRKDHHGTRYHYRVKSVKDLTEKIIPFFEKHSLKTKRKIEFQRFRRICLLMNKGYHRKSLQNFLEIYDLGLELRVLPGGRQTRSQNFSLRGQKVRKIIETLREILKSESDNFLLEKESLHQEGEE